MDIHEITRCIKEQMGEEDLHEVIVATMERFKYIHPEWELVYLSLPKYDRTERARILDVAMKSLQEEYFAQSK